jgi:nanoRNase/pAp phosphatase (c-di-AMP/oligoRNAs hydrolase)
VGTSLALFLFLRSLGKEVDVVSGGYRLPKNLYFLPEATAIKNKLPDDHNYVLKVPLQGDALHTISYDIKNDELYVFLKTDKRAAAPSSPTLQETNNQTAYDVIFIIDTADLASLGTLYSTHPNLFFETPIVTIDNDPAHEHFGHINVVELTATSAAEVLYHVMEELAPEKITKDIATCLLTGMIAETKSFKTQHITPHTLSIASKLIDKGANREEIVEYLYRTRSMAALKLWGRALARLQNESSLGLVWTDVNRDDFLYSGASEHDLHEIVQELISHTPETKVSAVFYECPGATNKVCALVSSEKQFDVKQLTKSFEPEGTRHQVLLTFNGKPLSEVRDTVIGNIKTILKQ